MDFDSIPSNLRVPFVAAEIDNSRASQGPALLAYRGLIIGQMTASGTGTADTLQRVTSANDVATLAGRGSLLHRQAMAWFHANKFTELWIGLLADAVAGAAAAGSILFAGTATADGTVSLYVGGELVEVPVATGDAAADVATALAALLPSASDHMVTGAVNVTTAEQVDITCRHKGEVGNGIDLRVNYADGEALPAGITATITAMTGGTTNPTLTNLIAAMGDTWFQVIAHPYTDATSLTALENELADRFGPLRMIDGVAITAKDDTLANLATLGEGRNSGHSVIAGTYKSPTPAFEVAANLAAVVAYYGADDPARPFQTLPLSWCKAPAESDRFTLQERNQLLYDGIATIRTASDGTVQIDRLITTYQTNTSGAADTSFLDLTTMLTLLYLRYSWRTLVSTKYPRHKLASDGTQIGAGQAVVTPKLMKAQAVLWFEEMEELGLVEDADQFKQDVVVERNAQDTNRLDVLLPPNIINKLIVTATKLEFLL